MLCGYFYVEKGGAPTYRAEGDTGDTCQGTFLGRRGSPTTRRHFLAFSPLLAFGARESRVYGQMISLQGRLLTDVIWARGGGLDGDEQAHHSRCHSGSRKLAPLAVRQQSQTIRFRRTVGTEPTPARGVTPVFSFLSHVCGLVISCRAAAFRPRCWQGSCLASETTTVIVLPIQ